MKNLVLIVFFTLFAPIVLFASSLRPETFYDGSGDYTDAFQKCIDIASLTGQPVELTGDQYKVRGGVILLKDNVYLFSNCFSRVYTEDHNNYNSIFFQDTNTCVNNIVIDGVFFDQSAEVNSPVPNNVAYFVVLLYWAKNVKITHCKFNHVGTNCIAICGIDCNGSIIQGNEISFMRLNGALAYDVSSIYVEDAGHLITDNYIHNDGKMINCQAGGIETHGAVGIVCNNRIEHCLHAINIVSFAHVNKAWNGEYKRTISNNVSIDCDVFATFWPISEYEIKNVSIINNKVSGCHMAVGVVASTALCGSIYNVTISTNCFISRYHEFVNVRNTSEPGHIFRFSAIGIQSHGDVQMSISDNIFEDFPATITDLNTYGQDVTTEVSFSNNNLINCFNSRVLEPLTYQAKLALFCVGPQANLNITNNTIGINQIDPSVPPLFLYGNMEGNISVENNRFTNYVAPIVSISDKSVQQYITACLLSEYPTQSHIGQTLNKGDVIIVGGRRRFCKTPGTNKKVALSHGVLHGGYVCFITCSNYKSIDVGDWIVINGEGLSQQARQVCAIVDDRIYLAFVSYVLPLGQEKKLSRVAFYPYTIE